MRLSRAVVAAAAVLACAPVQAQDDFPSQGIRFVVPYAAGGAPDTIARLVAQGLQSRIGRSVVVENRAGSNGNVAASVIATSPADGATLMVTSSAMLSVNPKFIAQLTYDPQKDFVPVALLARAPIFLAVHSGVPVTTLPEFVDYVRAHPGELNYGSSGVGSIHHLSMEAMKAALHLQMTHIPYRGAGQSVPALLGGHIQALFAAYPSIKGAVEAGRVKLLATNGGHRSPLAPDVPALGEIVPGFDLITLIGIFARAGTPATVVNRIASAALAVVKEPEVAGQFATLGMEPAGEGPDAFAKSIAGEIERVNKAANSAGIKPE
jgi:tripartite-type tricarboxylate transporter receptor subunit TctC